MALQAPRPELSPRPVDIRLRQAPPGQCTPDRTVTRGRKGTGMRRRDQERPWRSTLLELGIAPHPGEWVGPKEHFPDWMSSPVNALLVQDDETTVLVDAGSGIASSWWPYPGYSCDTLGTLAAAGVSAAEIDLIVLTHLDFDHAGGLLTGVWPGDVQLAFPGTPVAMLDGAAQAAREADPEADLNVATGLTALLEHEGLLVETSSGNEVISGIRLTSAPGHRPGHAIVEVDGHEPLTHMADVLHHEVHAQHPDWDGLADLEPDVALATRIRVLGQVADSGTNVVVSHVPGPDPLRIVREGDAFRFTKAPAAGPRQTTRSSDPETRG